jgi:proline dehydrogenase
LIRQVKDAVWTAWAVVAKRTARAYVPGPELEDALRVCRWLSGQSLATTIGYWDGTADPPPDVARKYLDVIAAISREGLKSYASIKAPSIGYEWALLSPVLERSAETGVPVHFDSLGPETADSCFALVEKARRVAPDVGCTLPSRWPRSIQDAERLADLGLRIRIVKGQWADPSAPRIDARANFLAIVDRLCGGASSVAVATHDVRLLRESLRRLRAAGTRAEVELLFGLPVRPPIRVARETGVPTRLYVPYGEAYLPYTLSQVRERPRIVWWIVRDTVLARTLFVPRSARR